MTLEAHRKAQIDAALTAAKAGLEAFVAEAKAAGADAVLVLKFSHEESERNFVFREVKAWGLDYQIGFDKPRAHIAPGTKGPLQFRALYKDNEPPKSLQVYVPKKEVPSPTDNSLNYWLIIFWP